MTTRQRVGIVGAGISGLAHAQVLRDHGFDVVVFEKGARIGGVWALTYPDVTLQNTGDHYHLTAFPWPSPPDLHPTGTQINAYLAAAVEALDLEVRLEHEVVSAEPTGEGWALTVRHAGETTVERVDFLVVAIGQYSEGKRRPAYEGEDRFAGRILTERDVRDLELFRDQRVVVCGFGKTAVDLASFAAARGAEVHHVFRSPRWLLPRYLLGVHMTWFLFNRFGSVLMTCWDHPTAPARLVHRRMGPFVRTFWRNVQRLVRFAARRSARGHGREGEQRLAAVLPTHDLLGDLRSAAAIEPPGYYAQVAAGAIHPHRGELARFEPDGVVLTDGTRIPCDLVALALGSESPRFPFLPADLRGLLEGEPDGVQLYRHLVHPRIPRLGFAGYNHGFMHVPAAEVGAHWLACWFKGELVPPPVEEMEATVERIRAWKRAHVGFEPSRSCAINTRFQQYLDVVLQDLGVSPYRKLPNPVAEVFGRYRAADYAGVGEELRRSPRPLRPVPLDM